jgi:hypothetical protein
MSEIRFAKKQRESRIKLKRSGGEVWRSFEKDEALHARRESAPFFCDRMSKDYGARESAIWRERYIYFNAEVNRRRGLRTYEDSSLRSE